MFCCTLLYVHFSIVIILMGKRELIALLNLSSWCLVVVERLFLAVPRGCLQFVIVVFPDHTHLLFSMFGHHLPASQTPFKWHFADDGPLLVVFGYSFPSSTKKACQSLTPCITVYRRKGAYRLKTAFPEPYPLQKRSISAKNKLSDRQ